MVTKNKLNYFGLLALIIVMVTIVMVLAACPDGSDSEKGTETLTLSGQVNERKVNEGLNGLLDLEDTENLDILSLVDEFSGELISYVPINGNMTVSDGGMGGTGKIENGKLSYSIRKPADGKFEPATDLLNAITSMLGGFLSDESLSEAGLPALSGLYANAKISPANTQAAHLILQINNDAYSLIDRESVQTALSYMPMGLTITVEGVGYVYVDRKATITAKGTSITVPINLKLSDINLNLKKGWNALGVKVTVTAGVTLVGITPSLNISGKVEYSCRQPSKVSDSLIWVANPPIESSEEGLVPPQAFLVPVE